MRRARQEAIVEGTAQERLCPPYENLDDPTYRPYDRAMINAVTIVIARRRRMFAAGADVRV